METTSTHYDSVESFTSHVAAIKASPEANRLTYARFSF